MRQLTNIRSAIAGLAACLLVAGSAVAQTTDVTLPQARLIALDALQKGNPKLALDIGKGLLKANQRDVAAYLILTGAYGQMDDARLSRMAAARAYRHSDSDELRLQAAQMAARSALAENRPTLTQVWLRRAAQNTDSDAVKSHIAKDYARVRQINPWGFNLRFGLAPSSNVNDGSSDTYNVIDGVPFVGLLSGSAQALSGMVGSLDVMSHYRLAQTDTALTVVGGRLYVERVALSSEAKALAPTLKNSDFASTVAEVNLRHSRKVGDDGGSVAGTAALGKTWYGGSSSINFLRLSGDRNWQLGKDRSLRLSLGAERRSGVQAAQDGSVIFSFGGLVGQRLKNGDQLTLSGTLRDVTSDDPNTEYQSANARLGYSFHKPIGPVKVSGGIGIGHTDYEQYSIGFIAAPGGRQDTRVYADMTFLFHKADYAGFAPTLNVRWAQASSNISRFDTRELSVSFGIQSTF